MLYANMIIDNVIKQFGKAMLQNKQKGFLSGVTKFSYIINWNLLG